MQAPATPIPSQSSKLAALLAAIVLVLIVAGLLTTSYASTVVFLIGAALAVGALALAGRLRVKRQESPDAGRSQMRTLGRVLLALLAVAAIAFCLLMVNMVLHIGTSYPYVGGEDAYVKEYTLTVKPAASGAFTAAERAVLEVQSQTPATGTLAAAMPAWEATHTVASVGKGWLLKEVTLSPLSDVELTMPDGSKAPAFISPAPGLKATVKLQGLPRGSFYAAKDALDVTVAPYLDTETVSWSVSSFSDDIVFAYIPSPFHHLRGLLSPFMTLASVGQWLMGILGAALGGVFSAYVKPPLVTLVQARLPRRLMPPGAKQGPSGEQKS